MTLAVADGRALVFATRSALLQSATDELEALEREESGTASSVHDPAWGLPSEASAGTRLVIVRLGVRALSVERGVFLGLIGGGDHMRFRTASRAAPALPLRQVLILQHAPPRTGTAAFWKRRAWFDDFLASRNTLRPSSGLDVLAGHPSLRHASTCPCCGYPTRRPDRHLPGGVLPTKPRLQNADASACLICCWSDADALELPDDEATPSPANLGMTLLAAAEAFVAYGDMYGEAEIAGPHLKLREPVHRRTRRTIRALFDSMPHTDDEVERIRLWRAAFATLRALPRSARRPAGLCNLDARPAHAGIAGVLSRLCGGQDPTL